MFPVSKIDTDFNPRSREGSDTERNCRYGRSSRFQSTLPRGERRERSQKKRTAQTFQSTLPRGERLLLLPCSVPPFSISIHAPARGATWHTRYPQKSDQFQSTLPRGERQNRKQKGDFAQKFQSTLPRGERQEQMFPQLRMPQFQSTLPRGERLRQGATCRKSRIFQSTLPRGERHYLASDTESVSYFNPRSREGSDLPTLRRDDVFFDISIHAPARGATKRTEPRRRKR